MVSQTPLPSPPASVPIGETNALDSSIEYSTASESHSADLSEELEEDCSELNSTYKEDDTSQDVASEEDSRSQDAEIDSFQFESHDDSEESYFGEGIFLYWIFLRSSNS